MLELLRPAIDRTETADGFVLASRTPLPPGPPNATDWLVKWAAERPDTVFLAERDPTGAWRTLGYEDTLRRVVGVASGLLQRGATPDRPILVLSDNGIDAAVLALAGMYVGIPTAPLSTAYSLQSESFARLRLLAEIVRPGLVFADDPVRYGPALAALGSIPAVSMADLARTPPSVEAERANAAVGADTIAKVLFTSGSTGQPKGVVNTQRMIVANQESLAACWPFLADRPPVVVDWLPWSHTFGGNHNFFLVLRNGGSLYVDRGRPAPGLINVTLANLADVSPTLWFNVPRGFDQAVPALERDPDLARRVFAGLDLLFYAAAALGPATRARLEQVAANAGREVFFTSAWGSTETAPLATSAHFPTAVVGVLGVPVPGVRLKLARVEDQLELRVAGPNVTPGYWQPGGGIVPATLDPDGFLPTGDAGRLVDPDDPDRGVAFVGRISENFKLSSGTWVVVAPVRIGVVEATAPLVQDAVIAGQDREGIGVLLVPSPAGLPEDAPARILAGLAAYNRAHPGSSQRVARALVLDRPLSLDDGETTDKGYTNQRQVLVRRADDVARLFAEPAGPGVLVP